MQNDIIRLWQWETPWQDAHCNLKFQNDKWNYKSVFNKHSCPDSYQLNSSPGLCLIQLTKDILFNVNIVYSSATIVNPRVFLMPKTNSVSTGIGMNSLACLHGCWQADEKCESQDACCRGIKYLNMLVWVNIKLENNFPKNVKIQSYASCKGAYL